MSTRQKRGGQNNSKPVTKSARVDRPIQGPEVDGAQLNSPNSPNSLPGLEKASDSDSEDDDENIGLVDDDGHDEEDEDPLRHLTVLQRNNLAAKKQGRQGR